MPPSGKAPGQILVEGKDDLWVINALLKRHGLDWDDKSNPHIPFIRDCKGIENLLKNELPLLLKNPSAYTTIGIVVDADLECIDRWTSIRHL